MLGFRIVGYSFEEPPVFAIVGRDGLTIMLHLIAGTRGGSNRDHHQDGIDAYLWTDDVDALHAELKSKGADIVSPPQLRSYA